MPRVYLERFSVRRLSGQSEAQKMIDHLLEGMTRLADFFLEQLGDIVIES